MGLDVDRLVSGAQEMAHACASCVPIEDNPGAVLGTVLGALATHGRDKVTLIASPQIGAVGAWIEQLLAESTGKAGLGIIPVDREPLGSPGVYGTDRLFVYLRLGTAPDPVQDAAVAALEQDGQPVVRIALDDPYDLGVEFFRWEFATAVAGSIIGVNPFDQPDVEASKAATRRLMAEHAKTGGLPAEAPILEAAPIELFADERNRAALAAAGARTLVDTLRAHLERIRPGNYLALLAYLETNEVNAAELQAMRTAIRDRYRIATCLGFGPRFLHSTGQAYKGGVSGRRHSPAASSPRSRRSCASSSVATTLGASGPRASRSRGPSSTGEAGSRTSRGSSMKTSWRRPSAPPSRS